MALHYDQRLQRCCGQRRSDYFISDVGVGIVHFGWNKYDVQIEVHTVPPSEHDGFQNIGYQLFSRKISYQLFRFIQKSIGTTLRRIEGPCSCKVWILTQLYSGSIRKKPISTEFSHAGSVDNDSTIAMASQLS